MEIPRREPLPESVPNDRPGWVWIGFQFGLGFALAFGLLQLIGVLIALSVFSGAVQWTFAGHHLN